MVVLLVLHRVVVAGSMRLLMRIIFVGMNRNIGSMLNGCVSRVTLLPTVKLVNEQDEPVV